MKVVLHGAMKSHRKKLLSKDQLTREQNLRIAKAVEVVEVAWVLRVVKVVIATPKVLRLLRKHRNMKTIKSQCNHTDKLNLLQKLKVRLNHSLGKTTRKRKSQKRWSQICLKRIRKKSLLIQTKKCNHKIKKQVQSLLRSIKPYNALTVPIRLQWTEITSHHPTQLILKRLRQPWKAKKKS